MRRYQVNRRGAENPPSPTTSRESTRRSEVAHTTKPRAEIEQTGPPCCSATMMLSVEYRRRPPKYAPRHAEAAGQPARRRPVL